MDWAADTPAHGATALGTTRFGGYLGDRFRSSTADHDLSAGAGTSFRDDGDAWYRPERHWCLPTHPQQARAHNGRPAHGPHIHRVGEGDRARLHDDPYIARAAEASSDAQRLLLALGEEDGYTAARCRERAGQEAAAEEDRQRRARWRAAAGEAEARALAARGYGTVTEAAAEERRLAEQQQQRQEAKHAQHFSAWPVASQAAPGAQAALRGSSLGEVAPDELFLWGEVFERCVPLALTMRNLVRVLQLLSPHSF